MSVTIALDTSTALTCAGIEVAGGLRDEVFDFPDPGSRPNHATAGLALLSGLLKSAGVDWSEVSRVVVGVGPGSFTGLRVGIATALGLSRGSGAEAVGVSGLDALLLGVGAATPACGLLDARRGELFVQSSEAGSAPICVARDLSGLVLKDGCLCVGDGAVLERDLLVARGFDVPDADSPLHRISPLAMIDLASRGRTIDVSTPVYVREPDAVASSDRQAL